MILLLIIGVQVSSATVKAKTTSSADLRRCLGKFATGVTVITCNDAAGNPCGITANSFSSVSLEPPLVLWNIAKVSQSLQAYLNADYFAINILAENQQQLASHFARSDHTLFDTVQFAASSRGVPVLPGTVASLECKTQQIHDCGDHHIIVGEVEDFRSNGQAPLLFFGGTYAKLLSS